MADTFLSAPQISMSALGRFRPVAAIAGFPHWQPDILV
jgi:hypothetical protein